MPLVLVSYTQPHALGYNVKLLWVLVKKFETPCLDPHLI